MKTDETRIRRKCGPGFPGSTGGPPVGDGGLAVADFSCLPIFLEIVAASRRNQQAGRLRSPDVRSSTREENVWPR
jgi:hypothetical protein